MSRAGRGGGGGHRGASVGLADRAMPPLTVTLECLRLDHLTAVATDHQVEVILRRAVPKHGHVFWEGEGVTQKAEGQKVTGL